MPLTFPAPSKRLRQANELAQQVYSSIHELQELADGEPNIEEELRQLHSSINALIHRMNEELTCWQQSAVTAAEFMNYPFRTGKNPDPLTSGLLAGSIQVRAGEKMKPLTVTELLGIDSWWPVHRGE